MTGEQAGYFLEDVEQHEYDILRWKNGELSMEEAVDMGVLDEHGNLPNGGKVE